MKSHTFIIKDEKLWNQSILDLGKEPKNEYDWQEVTAIYRKLGGKIFVKGVKKESLTGDLKNFLKKWITNPIILGIALYFLGRQLNKYIKK